MVGSYITVNLLQHSGSYSKAATIIAGNSCLSSWDRNVNDKARIVQWPPSLTTLHWHDWQQDMRTKSPAMVGAYACPEVTTPMSTQSAVLATSTGSNGMLCATGA